MPQKKDKPKFLRPNYGRTSRARVKKNWRKQRGCDNKKRMGRRYMGFSPSIGYGQDSRIKGFHPSGKQEVLVHNLRELSEVPKDSVARIASPVGKRLRQKMLEHAKSNSIKIVNSGENKFTLPEPKKKAKAKKPKKEKKQKKEDVKTNENKTKDEAKPGDKTSEGNKGIKKEDEAKPGDKTSEGNKGIKKEDEAKPEDAKSKEAKKDEGKQ